jgi:hypothetical protein
MALPRAVADILATGMGTKASPFVVREIAEEYLVVQHFGKKARGQQLVELSGKPCDCITCSDETEYWFDVSNTPIWRKSEEDMSKSHFSFWRALILMVLAIAAALLAILLF